ncbi:MAG: flagellar basal body-associated FliL family protein [Erythrobacter sp.]|nr:flagellar basal body-associated FliL family protein [Erythrobacter sp.]
MIRKLIPILFGLIGLGIGLGAGFYLRPAAQSVSGAILDDSETAHGGSSLPEAASDHAGAENIEPNAHGTDESGSEYVKLSNQFVIPIVEEGRVVSMVILALTLEVDAGATEAIYAREPKLRDVFLQVLFDHANSGGFNGSFTDGSNLVLLRKALRETAQKTIGPNVTDVLISDIARQDS